MASPVYPSDLTDEEWALLAPLISVAKPRGRPRVREVRLIVNGLFFSLRTGCPWRYLPREYGPWQTVYSHFRKWRLDGTWVRIHTHLREVARFHAGRDPTKSAAITASQSVKTQAGGVRSFDGEKRAIRAQAPPPGGYPGLDPLGRGTRG